MGRKVTGFGSEVTVYGISTQVTSDGITSKPAQEPLSSERCCRIFAVGDRLWEPSMTVGYWYLLPDVDRHGDLLWDAFEVTIYGMPCSPHMFRAALR